MTNTNSDGNLDMDFFSNSDDIQLNFESNPDDTEYTSDDVGLPESELEEEAEEGDEQDIITGEDQNDSEEVTGEEDQEEEGGESTDEESEDVSPNDNLYASFASVLSEKGLLPSLDLQNNDIKDIDGLTEHLKNEIENQAKQFLVDKVGEDGYAALQKGISLSEYQQYHNNITTLDGIDDAALESDLELAKQIIKQDYLSQGMDEGRANRILKKSIDLGDDVVLEDARESLQSLKVIEGKRLEALAGQREQQRVNSIKMQEKIDNDLKNSIYNEDEYFKGLKVNKVLKDKIYSSITKVVGQSPEGVAENKLMRDRREDPINFDKKLYYIYEITNGFSDISKINAKSESKLSKQLEAQLRKGQFEGGDKPSYMSDPESYGGTGTELVF